MHRGMVVDIKDLVPRCLRKLKTKRLLDSLDHS